MLQLIPKSITVTTHMERVAFRIFFFFFFFWGGGGGWGKFLKEKRRLFHEKELWGIMVIFGVGRMAEWLRYLTLNHNIVGSSPAVH